MGQQDEWLDDDSVLSELVRRAENTRQEIGRLYRTDGLRFRGFNDLLRYLHVLCDDAADDPALKRIRFFIDRTLSNVEASLIAVCHGLLGAATDAMRDMMEIQLLLRHFVHEPTSIERWWTAPSAERKREFKPVLLRKRHAARSGESIDPVEQRDYALHSGMLHLTPERSIRRGVATDPDMMFEIDLLFAEIMWHSIGVVRQYRELALTLNPATDAPGLESAPLFLDAAENALTFTMGFISAAATAARQSNGRAEPSVDE